jgi:hypothetical protein
LPDSLYFRRKGDGVAKSQKCPLFFYGRRKNLPMQKSGGFLALAGFRCTAWSRDLKARRKYALGEKGGVGISDWQGGIDSRSKTAVKSWRQFKSDRVNTTLGRSYAEMLQMKMLKMLHEAFSHPA